MVSFITQRVRMYYNFGIKSQKAILIMVLGPNSAIAVYMDPLGGNRTHEMRYKETAPTLQSPSKPLKTATKCSRSSIQSMKQPNSISGNKPYGNSLPSSQQAAADNIQVYKDPTLANLANNKAFSTEV